jgi:hypothetical protein
MMAFTLMPRVAMARFKWPNFAVAVPTMTDPTFIAAIVASALVADRIKDKIVLITEEVTRKVVPAANIYSNNTQKIEKAVINELKATTDWVDKNKPNIAYQNQLEKLKNRLNTAEVLSDKKLKDIESDFFTSGDALNNMSKVYGKNSSTYESILYNDKPLCPPVMSNGPGILSVPYTELQVRSCQTVYNAIAYKEEVNNILANKDKIIDEITNDTLNGIIQLPSKTIGDYNARQTALETIRLLRKVAINDNDIKLHNAEIEIEIAQHERKYAANSILTGPPKSAAVQTTIGIAELALGTALGALVSTVAPYNE